MAGGLLYAFVQIIIRILIGAAAALLDALRLIGTVANRAITHLVLNVHIFLYDWAKIAVEFSTRH